jgi:hypothetical protein
MPARVTAPSIELIHRPAKGPSSSWLTPFRLKYEQFVNLMSGKFTKDHPPGTKLSVQYVDWAAKKRTMLMVLSNTCRFCTESVDFYKKLAQERAKHYDARIIAVLPQDVEAGKTNLNKLALSRTIAVPSLRCITT